jgi:asparagine synthase (glutamine-hydrolysing)
MCGIAGRFAIQRPSDTTQMRRALSRIVHRGPDGEGIEEISTPMGSLTLGHRRLSIIDLSEAGLQPMSSVQGRFTITFNGEIYNYVELREELRGFGHVFTTGTDTEVLLTAWAEWGEACLPKLDGMYAFAIYDRANGTLTCVRDPFGIKPFYYSKEHCDGFAFASEVQPLLELLTSTPRLNRNRAYLYLRWTELDDADDSFYEGVSQLRPGHLLRLKLNGVEQVTIHKWWWPTIKEDTSITFEDAAEKLRHLFLQSVRRQLRSDVDWGAALSGGVDSSAIVCAIRHIEPDLPIKTFSYVARGAKVNEESWCKIVEDQADVLAHYTDYPASEMCSDLDEIVAAQGEPMAGTSFAAQYRVFKLAKEAGVTVTLDGQGADELLAGYFGYPTSAFQSYVDRRDFVGLYKMMRQWQAWPSRSWKQAILHLGDATVPVPLRAFALRMIGLDPSPGWLRRDVLAAAGVDTRSFTQLPEDRDGHGRRLSERLRNALTISRLPTLLRHGDRNSMHWSIESRVPFLSPGIAEFALSMPERFHLSEGGETKHLFRRAMRGIMPDSILDRRDKIGFETPERDILLQERHKIDGWLQIAHQIDFLDADLVRKEVNDIIDGNIRYSFRAWRMIALCRWAALQPTGVLRT